MMQQCIAGDSWGMITLPIIEHSPLSAVFFGIMFISLEITLMNVILATVVDSANQARTEDLNSKAAKVKLIELCACLDDDGSGELTFEELVEGFRSNRDFKRQMTRMDINENDCRTVWDIIDSDGSGTVSCDEFTEELLKMKSANPHTMLIMIRHNAAQTRARVEKDFNELKETLLAAEERQLRIVAKLERDEKETNKVLMDLEHQTKQLHESTSFLKRQPTGALDGSQALNTDNGVLNGCDAKDAGTDGLNGSMTCIELEPESKETLPLNRAMAFEYQKCDVDEPSESLKRLPATRAGLPTQLFPLSRAADPCNGQTSSRPQWGTDRSEAKGLCDNLQPCPGQT